MRRSRHTDDEMAFLLREAEQGTPVSTICASARISIGTFYRWRRRLGGLPPVAITRLRRIEEENSRLRAELARLTHAGRVLRDAEAARHRALTPANRNGATRQPNPIHRGSDIAVGRFAFVRTTH